MTFKVWRDFPKMQPHAHNQQTYNYDPSSVTHMAMISPIIILTMGSLSF